MAEAGIEASVGSVGDCDDNALAETINGLYKAEVIHRHSWPNRDGVEWATLDGVDWFNHKRLPGPVADIPPAEAEAAYHRQQKRQAVAAGLKPSSLRETRGWSRRGLARALDGLCFATIPCTV